MKTEIPPLFFIDHSALINMFAGKKSGDKLLKKMYDLKNEGKVVRAITSLSCFLRAIYLSEPDLKVNSIQKTLNFMKVIPSFADFKDEKVVIDEIIRIVNISKQNENNN